MDMMGFFNATNIFVFVVIAIPLLGLALYLFARVLSAKRQTNQALRHWATVGGRVLAANVEARTSTGANNHRTTSYYPNVLYEYMVNGQRYQNNRVNLGMDVGYGDYGRVQRTVMQNYPVGGTVQIYYDPQDPTQSSLELKTPAAKWIWVIIAVLVMSLVCSGVFMMGMGSFMGVVQDFINQFMPK